MSQRTDSDVIVVGAGPVGLATALALRSVGRSVTVFESGAMERLRPGSRAIFVHGESIVTLERFSPGLQSQLVGHGVVWPTKRTLYRGREVFSRTYPPPPAGTVPQFTSLPQIETERYLREACEQVDVDFRWSSQVEVVTVDGDVVHVTAADGRAAAAPFVVGADGSRSVVRGAMGIAMRGSRSEGHYVVVDVAEDPDEPLPVERVFHYEHPGIDHRNVLLVPFAGGWRVDLQLHETDDPEAFGDEAGVRRWLPRIIDAKYADRLGWVSTYQFLQVVADRFADPSGRVLLVGEAAHLFAPFGARGMNSGIADADAAATAIHLALGASNAQRAAAAVEQFARTRLAAAEHNRAAAGSALAHLRPSPAHRWKLRAAARASSVLPSCGAWLERAPYGPRTSPPSEVAGRY